MHGAKATPDLVHELHGGIVHAILLQCKQKPNIIIKDSNRTLCDRGLTRRFERISTKTRAYHGSIGGGLVTDCADESLQLPEKKVVQVGRSCIILSDTDVKLRNVGYAFWRTDFHAGIPISGDHHRSCNYNRLEVARMLLCKTRNKHCSLKT